MIGVGIALGLDPGLYLRADPVERAALTRALDAAGRYREKLDRRLAQMIIAELAAALKKGR